MKKLFISALLAIAVTVSSFAAEGNKVNYAALQNFATEFKHVSDVEWTSGDNFTKATFILNNVRTEALFSSDGELLGTSQAVTLDALPVNAKRSFAKRYSGYTVKEAIHFDGVDEDVYYISAENEKGSVVLKVEKSGVISTVKN